MITNYRDHAANERTYLAWVRTGVTVMVLGFFVEKFEIFLMSSDPATPPPSQEISGLAVFLVALGLLSIVYATVNYVRTNRAIDHEEELRFKDLTLPLLMSGLLVLFGIGLMLTLMWVI